MGGRSRRVVAGLTLTAGAGIAALACTPDTLPDGRNVYEVGCVYAGQLQGANGVQTWVGDITGDGRADYQCGGLRRRPTDTEFWEIVRHLRSSGWQENDHVYDAASTRGTWTP